MLFEKGVKEEYFEWLYNKVCIGKVHAGVSFQYLFEFLHGIEFTYSIPLDENRASDGIGLRYRFAREIDNMRVLDVLDGPCSVLEMMLALAIRCEETIMADTRYGDRTSQWFWNMMSNLGIGMMADDVFKPEFVEEAVYNFLDRNYRQDGKGGLFYIPGCSDDLRQEEIWVQLCWYLDNYE